MIENITHLFLCSSLNLSLSLLACAMPAFEARMQLPVRGNCGEMTCEDLWRSLNTQWSEQMAEFGTECPQVGLNVWEDGDKKSVSVVCWEDTKVGKDGTIYGEYYRTFPYPSYEATFLAPKDCNGNPDCEKILPKLEASHAEELLKMQQTCAFWSGFLWYNKNESDPKKIDVACAFYAPNIQMDDNGDGVMDGEGKPTGVDFPLGSFTLDNL